MVMRFVGFLILGVYPEFLREIACFFEIMGVVIFSETVLYLESCFPPMGVKYSFPH